MPVFKKQFYSEIVPENVQLHSPLTLSVQAESPLGRKLIYSIVKGNELEEFALDFNTGKISVFSIPCSLFISFTSRTEDNFCSFFPRPLTGDDYQITAPPLNFTSVKEFLNAFLYSDASSNSSTGIFGASRVSFVFDVLR